MPSPDARSTYLRRLHEEYAEKVNRLVAEDREDLIAEVVDAYTDEALRVITAGPEHHGPWPRL